jgi:hypothetical protein
LTGDGEPVAEPPVPGAEPADELPADPEAYDSPRAVQARARGLAAPYIPGGLDPDPEATRRRERRYLRLLIAMVIALVLSGFVLGYLALLFEVPASSTTAAGSGAVRTAAPTDAATANPTELPTASPPIATPILSGPLEDGVPTTLGGEAVIRGQALLHAEGAATDDARFLVGGWFHAERSVMFCTFQRPPRAVDRCAGFALYVGSSTRLGIIVAQGTDGLRSLEVDEAAFRPVVLRVHTHDPRCPAANTSCPDQLVLDTVAWLGPSLAAPPPAPHETPPPTSFTRHEAVARARRIIGTAYVLRSVTVVRGTMAEGIRLGPVAEDPWVWWLKYRIPGTNSTARVVLDYLTGEELLRSYGSGP